MFNSRDEQQNINNNNHTSTDDSNKKQISLKEHFEESKYNISPNDQSTLVATFTEDKEIVMDFTNKERIPPETYFLAMAEAIAHTQHNIEKINLSVPLLSKKCARIFFENVALDKNIKALNLPSCKEIFNDDVDDTDSIKFALQKLLKNKSLSELDLSRTNMPLHVLLAVCEAIPSSGLTALNLGFSFIHDEKSHEQILIALAKAISASKLQMVALGLMKISQKAYDTLQNVVLKSHSIMIFTENCSYNGAVLENNHFRITNITSRLINSSISKTNNNSERSDSLADHFSQAKYALSPEKQLDLINIFSQETSSSRGGSEQDFSVQYSKTNFTEDSLALLAMAEAFGHIQHSVKQFFFPNHILASEYICTLLNNIAIDSSMETLGFYNTSFVTNGDAEVVKNAMAFKSLINTSKSLKCLLLLDSNIHVSCILAICEALQFSSSITKLSFHNSIKAKDAEQVIASLADTAQKSNLKIVTFSKLDFTESMYKNMETAAKQSRDIAIYTKECRYRNNILSEDHFAQINKQFRNAAFLQQRLAETKTPATEVKDVEATFKHAFNHLIEAGAMSIVVPPDEKKEKSISVILQADSSIITQINRLIKLCMISGIQVSIKNEKNNFSSLTISARKESILLSLVGNKKFTVKDISIKNNTSANNNNTNNNNNDKCKRSNNSMPLLTMPTKVPTVCELTPIQEQAWKTELMHLVCKAPEVTVTWHGADKKFTMKLPLGTWHIQDGSKNNSEVVMTEESWKAIKTSFKNYLVNSQQAKISYDDTNHITTVEPYEKMPPSLKQHQASIYGRLAPSKKINDHQEETNNNSSHQQTSVNSTTTNMVETKVDTTTKQEQPTEESPTNRAKSLFNEITDQQLANGFDILTPVAPTKKTKKQIIFTFNHAGAKELALTGIHAGHRVNSLELMQALAKAINDQLSGGMNVIVDDTKCIIILDKNTLDEIRKQLSEIKNRFRMPKIDVTEDNRRKEGKEEMELPEDKETQTSSSLPKQKIKLGDFIRQQIKNCENIDAQAKKENKSDCTIIANLGYHLQNMIMSKPSQETIEKDIVNYLNFILHSCRVLEIITHNVYGNPIEGYDLLRDYRNVSRHAFSATNWHEMYTTLLPLIKAIYRILMHDNSRKNINQEDPKRLQELLQKFEAQLRNYTLSSVMSNQDKDFYKNTLKSMLADVIHHKDEKTRNALVAAMTVVGEFLVENDGILDAEQLRGVYRRVGHDIRTPFAQLASDCIAVICPSQKPSVSMA